MPLEEPCWVLLIELYINLTYCAHAVADISGSIDPLF